MSIQYTAIFHGCKNGNYCMKKMDFFLIFAQNKDCGYMLELPREAVLTNTPQSMFYSKNKKIMFYTPVNPSLPI